MTDTISTRLRQPGAARKLALVVGIPALVLVAFAATAGVFSPDRLTPHTLIASLGAGDTPHPGFRRNHAKGVCVTGWFEGNGNAASISRAALFGPIRSRVVGRFSLGGGMPFQPDAPDKVRALGLQILPPDHSEWRTAMINFPVFPAPNVVDFNGLLLATAPDPATHKPNPARAGAFIGSHPETAAALGIIKSQPPSPGFAADSFHGLDAFLFVDANGHATPVRWSFVPVPADGAPSPAATTKPDDKNYLFDDVIGVIARGPLRWKLVLTLADPADQTADPAKMWPAGRRTIDAGTLVLDTAASEDQGADGAAPCNTITYDPTVLPPGITLSDDALPAARSAAYARSFALRSGETKAPSAITPQAISTADASAKGVQP